jgi:hypothetical protein
MLLYFQMHDVHMHIYLYVQYCVPKEFSKNVKMDGYLKHQNHHFTIFISRNWRTVLHKSRFRMYVHMYVCTQKC